MDLGLTNKVILIAAGSKGLGFGIARAVANDGAKVVIGSREAKHLKIAEQALGSGALATVLDVTNPSTITKWCEQALKHFGRIDGLVVNAGGPPAGQFDDFQDEHWQAAFELTLMSAVRLIRSVLPSMRKQGSGSILTVTSSSVKEPIEHLLLSNVLRAGVHSLVKSLSQQLASDNIRINNLIPGRFETERLKHLIADKEQYKKEQLAIPLGRFGTIDEFGKVGAFLLSEAASYITGSSLVVDGGKIKSV